MSERVVTTVDCDVCGKPFWTSDSGDGAPEQRPEKLHMPAWFLTEQTEGRSTKPYLCAVDIDLCPECAEKAIRLRAIGAQGYNDYSIAP